VNSVSRLAPGGGGCAMASITCKRGIVDVNERVHLD
jgi:hypothetical protein